jgi:hypothetical protein
VEQVRATLNDRAHEGWFNAFNVSMALHDLSWNLFASRLLDNFGATSLCAKSAFADSGYSHPNFELRLLVANQLLSGDHTYDGMMENFETCRRKKQAVWFKSDQ